jgi:hypothetical protein
MAKHKRQVQAETAESGKMRRKGFDKELAKLQIELTHLH